MDSAYDFIGDHLRDAGEKRAIWKLVRQSMPPTPGLLHEYRPSAYLLPNPADHVHVARYGWDRSFPGVRHNRRQHDRSFIRAPNGLVVRRTLGPAVASAARRYVHRGGPAGGH